MKIVCDNCATKYSIADEKVRGKVFKIRCKKCSHIIVVRGGEGAAATAEAAHDAGFPAEEPAAPPPRAAPPAGASLGTGEAVWHLVVDREQIGPLTKEEVHAKFRAGEVDLETYAWREGFADWLRLGSIEDFRDLAGDGAAGEGATRRTDTADLFATAGAAPASSHDDAPTTADLFGGHNSPSAPTGEAVMPTPAAAASDMFSGGGNALFGAPQAQAAAPASAQRQARTASPGFSGGGAAMAAAAEPAADAGSQKMTGQRNENSVLFSLNNLQALASGSGGAAKPSGGGGGGGGSAPAPEPRPGFANSQTEGSGLIDIRAMAASTLSADPTRPSTGKSDEPSFASQPMFSPIAAPILMPAPASGPPKWIWALLGVGVLAVVGIVVVGVLLLAKKDPPPQVIVQAPPVAPVQPVAVAGNVPPAAANTPPAANPGATPAVEAPKDPKHHGSRTPKEAKPGSPGAATPAAVSAPPPSNSKQPVKKKGGDELDDLLNAATPGDKPAPKHSAPEPAGGGADLPNQLGKGDIVKGMGSVKGKVSDCYGQFKVPGMANVSVTIGKNGHVSAATVSGSFAGTPTGSCVERAVKSASFSPFKGSPQTISYPFMLR